MVVGESSTLLSKRRYVSGSNVLLKRLLSEKTASVLCNRRYSVCLAVHSVLQTCGVLSFHWKIASQDLHWVTDTHSECSETIAYPPVTLVIMPHAGHNQIAKKLGRSSVLCINVQQITM